MERMYATVTCGARPHVQVTKGPGLPGPAPCSALTVLGRNFHARAEEDDGKGQSHELQNLVNALAHHGRLHVKSKDSLLQDGDTRASFF